MGHQHFLYARKVCKGQDSEGSSQKWALKGKIHQAEMLFQHAVTALLLSSKESRHGIEKRKSCGFFRSPYGKCHTDNL